MSVQIVRRQCLFKKILMHLLISEDEDKAYYK